MSGLLSGHSRSQEGPGLAGLDAGPLRRIDRGDTESRQRFTSVGAILLRLKAC